MNKDKLAEEIRFELNQLHGNVEIARQLAAIPEAGRRPWDAAAAAKYISDVIAGLENLCKRRNAALNRKSPEGPDFHKRILDDFIAEKQLGGRMMPENIGYLKKYLRFRHRFLHGYGHEINWGIVEEPLAKLVQRLTKGIGAGPHMDFNVFMEAVDHDASEHNVKMTTKRQKFLESELAKKDENAKPVIKKIHKYGQAEANPVEGLFAVTLDGKKHLVEYEPDIDLRDT